MFIYARRSDGMDILVNSDHVDFIENSGPNPELVTVHLRGREDPIFIKDDFDYLMSLLLIPKVRVVPALENPLQVEASVYQGC